MQTQATHHPFELPRPSKGLQDFLFQALKEPAENFLGLTRLGQIWQGINPGASPSEFLDASLMALGQAWSAEGSGATQFPAQGAVITVANHPFGGIEGMVLARFLLGIREDVRVLGNPILCRIPQLSSIIIPTDPFERGDSRNRVALRAAEEHLARGGCLVMFPSGAVSHYQPTLGGIIDPPWKKAAAWLALRQKVPVVPIYIPGTNGALFQMAGMVHPLLRTALLPRELLARRKPIRLRVGLSIRITRITSFRDTPTLTQYLRHRVYLLASKKKKILGDGLSRFRKPLGRAQDPAAIALEISRLDPKCRLLHQGDLEVWCAPGAHIPRVLREIGRLREETFRAIGEGTGRAFDLDRFDRWYEHLFLWHPGRREIAGAYRIGVVDEILAHMGRRGLYTQTCFRYHPMFFKSLPPALELGRSFVALPWQKEFAPLLLLWKGIAARIVREPKRAVVFGAVSMDNGYDSKSRELVVSYLRQHQLDPALARWVKPRIPVHVPRGGAVNLFEAAAALSGVEELGEVISSREGDGRGIPVLLRQYLKLGGRMVAFHRDPKFGQVIDALVVVDLRRTDEKTLERYLGKEGKAHFQGFWASEGMKLTQS